MADMTSELFIEAIGSRLKPINDAIRLKNRKKDLYTLDTMDDAVNLIELGVPDGAWFQTVHFVDEEGNTLLDDAVLTVDERFTEAVFVAPDIEGADNLTPNPTRLIFKLQGEDAEHTIVYEAWAYDTILDIVLTDSTALTINFRAQLNGSLTIDWGDGTEPETISATNTFASNDSGTYLSHAYTDVGEYTIKVTAPDQATYYHPRASSAATGRNMFGDSSYGICTYASWAKNMTGVAMSAFRYCSNLEAELLPNTVFEVEGYAFDGCAKLAWEKLSDSLTTIGEYAFNGCSKLAVTEIPLGVTSIGKYAFQKCISLEQLNIPVGVAALQTYVFAYCTGLKNVAALGVSTVAARAFEGSTGLKSVQLGSPGYPVTSIDSTAFRNCSQAGLEITIYTTDGAALSSQPWEATNATITYMEA